MELLLVLALLTVVAALAAPALKRPFANQRLSAAADTVRTAWCLARNEAMRSGATHAFQCILGGSSFRTERCSQEPQDESWAWERSSEQGASSSETNSLAHAPRAVLRDLPEHLVFGAMTVSADAESDMAAGNLEQVAKSGWSHPIFFYADGTTSDARLVLVNDTGSRVELTLRGLTGTVLVGEARASQEALP